LLKYPDGRQYDGQLLDDKKSGFGEYLFKDGKKYIGGWLNGDQHGEGTFINEKGRKKRGIWEHGKRINWLDKSSKRTGGSSSQMSSLVNLNEK